MKIIQSTWFVAIFGVVLYVLTMTYSFFRHKDELLGSVSNINNTSLNEKINYWDFRTQEIETLVTNLKIEEGKLRDKKTALLEIEERVKVEKEDLKKLQNEITAYRDDLSKIIIQIEKSETKNLKTLAATYSNISPQAAVSILSKMDDTLVVKILSLMKPDGVGPIFEQMASTEGESGPMAIRAAHISEKLRLHLSSN